MISKSIHNNRTISAFWHSLMQVLIYWFLCIVINLQIWVAVWTISTPFRPMLIQSRPKRAVSRIVFCWSCDLRIQNHSGCHTKWSLWFGTTCNNKANVAITTIEYCQLATVHSHYGREGSRHDWSRNNQSWSTILYESVTSSIN